MRQLADWALRLVTIWFFLDAFGVEQSVQNVLLVQVTHSLATLVPISPGGIGTEQAFLVFAFQGKVPGHAARVQRGDANHFTAVNATAGAIALLLSLRTVRYKQVYRGRRGGEGGSARFEQVGVRAGAGLGLGVGHDDVAPGRQLGRHVCRQQHLVGCERRPVRSVVHPDEAADDRLPDRDLVAIEGLPSDFNSGSGVTGLN